MCTWLRDPKYTQRRTPLYWQQTSNDKKLAILLQLNAYKFLESLWSCAPPPIVWSVSYSEVRILSNMCKEIATNYFHWRFASNKGSYVANPTLWNGAKFWPKLSTQKFKRSKNSNKKSNASYYLWPEWKDGIQKDSKSTFTNICQTASLRFSVNRENFCKSRPDFHKTRPTSTRTSGKYTARSFN